MEVSGGFELTRSLVHFLFFFHFWSCWSLLGYFRWFVCWWEGDS